MRVDAATVRFSDGSLGICRRDSNGGFAWTHASSSMRAALDDFAERYQLSSVDPDPLLAHAAAAAEEFEGELLTQALPNRDPVGVVY